MATPGGAFLRTRVARRVLGLFLLCAMLPVTVLSIFGYRYLAGELETQARQQLRAESKAAGMLLLDRLGSLAGYLEQLAAQARGGRPLALVAGASTDHGPRFRAVVRETPRGDMQALLGEVATSPSLDEARLRHLRKGGVSLVSRQEGQSVLVFLVTSIEGGGRLWGLVESATVWGADPDRSPAPPGRMACIATAELNPLFCPMSEALAALGTTDDGTTLQWTKGDERFVAGRWTIFLGRDYASPSWKVMVSVPERSIYTPLNVLRWTFLLGLVLALAAVFALSHIQLRRTMQPLEALETGTKRVAKGDFTEPVVVRSNDEFEVLAASFNRMAGDLERQFRAQRALQKVHQTALTATGPAPLLAALFDSRANLLPGNELTVALARPDDPFWWAVSDEPCFGEGRSPRDVCPTRSELEELGAWPQGLVARRGERARSYFSRPGEVLLREMIVLPILRKGALAGAFVLGCEPIEEGRPETLDEARLGVDRIAVAISNTQLVEQLEAMSWGALTALARTIDAVSPWTGGHSERVTIGAMEIARRLGLSEDDVDLLHRGGLLHDIGKVAVPAAILDRPGPLTPEEFDTVRAHPTTGARILAPIGAFRQALPLVLHHHEMLDGSGYPYGLKGDQIPRLVRVLTVADVFDALVSDRPYRPAWPTPNAVAYLRENAGTRFDGAAVEALAAAVASGWVPAKQTGGRMEVRASGRFSPWLDSGDGALTAGLASSEPAIP